MGDTEVQGLTTWREPSNGGFRSRQARRSGRCWTRSEALGKPKSAIVRELLDEAAPALQTTLDALAMIKTRP